jgi:hypothetical protein
MKPKLRRWEGWMGRKKIDIKDKKLYLNFVYLADEEHLWLVENLGQAATDNWIEELNGALGQHGYKYESHYWTIRNWARKKAQSSPSPEKAKSTAAISAADEVIEALKFPANRTMPQMEEKIKEALFSVMRKRKMNWFDLRDKRHDGTFMEEIHADIVKEYK